MAHIGGFKNCWNYFIDKMGKIEGERYVIIYDLRAKHFMCMEVSEWLHKQTLISYKNLRMAVDVHLEHVAEMIRPRNVDLFKEFYLDDKEKSLQTGKRQADSNSKLDVGTTGDKSG
jgi:hypothetical protein